MGKTAVFEPFAAAAGCEDEAAAECERVRALREELVLAYQGKALRPSEGPSEIMEAWLASLFPQPVNVGFGDEALIVRIGEIEAALIAYGYELADFVDIQEEAAQKMNFGQKIEIDAPNPANGAVA